MEFEKKLQELSKKRKQMNETNSFDEAAKLYEEITKLYKECEKELKSVEASQSTTKKEKMNNLSFQEAFSSMEKIINNIDNIKFEEIPNTVMKINSLSDFCLKKLEAEKAKMTQIKE